MILIYYSKIVYQQSATRMNLEVFLLHSSHESYWIYVSIKVNLWMNREHWCSKTGPSANIEAKF